MPNPLASDVAAVSDNVADLSRNQRVRDLHDATRTPIRLLTETPAGSAARNHLETSTALKKTAPDAVVRGSLEALIETSLNKMKQATRRVREARRQVMTASPETSCSDGQT